MCYREINTEKWEKCIYITGDTVTNPQEPSTLVRQTLEFSTNAIEYKNDDGDIIMNFYIDETLKETLTKVKMESDI